MTTISDTFINALLADSSYIHTLTKDMQGGDLLTALKPRMTEQLAKYISDNFKVKAVYNATDDGFNVVVWEGIKDEFTGQIYVSIRGTDGTQDKLDDVGLATKGVVYTQLKEMVNWWLRETTPNGLMAPQITIATVSLPNVPDQNFFISAANVMSNTPLLATVSAIKSVNAHSLGGYLATSFARIFSKAFPIESVNTFNSAGFSKLATSNIESEFTNIKTAIGSQFGFDNFTSVPQNNYFAKNGINVTTNVWDPVGFMQYDQRIEINQEDGVKFAQTQTTSNTGTTPQFAVTIFPSTAANYSFYRGIA